MNIQKLDAYIRNSDGGGRTPVGRYNLDGENILIAEGYRPAGDPEFIDPHFDVMWVWAREGPMVAQRMRISAIHHPFQKQRAEIALADAKEFINAAH